MMKWHKVMPWIVAHDVEIFLFGFFVVVLLTINSI